MLLLLTFGYRNDERFYASNKSTDENDPGTHQSKCSILSKTLSASGTGTRHYTGPYLTSKGSCCIDGKACGKYLQEFLVELLFSSSCIL